MGLLRWGSMDRQLSFLVTRRARWFLHRDAIRSLGKRFAPRGVFFLERGFRGCVAAFMLVRIRLNPCLIVLSSGSLRCW
jgi:hypothetical protein